jgi:hypothetical protein
MLEAVEDSKLHTRRRENLKSHPSQCAYAPGKLAFNDKINTTAGDGRFVVYLTTLSAAHNTTASNDKMTNE